MLWLSGKHFLFVTSEAQLSFLIVHINRASIRLIISIEKKSFDQIQIPILLINVVISTFKKYNPAQFDRNRVTVKSITVKIRLTVLCRSGPTILILFPTGISAGTLQS